MISRWCWILVASLLTALALAGGPIELRGDGIEYWMTTLALVKHLSVDIRAADLEPFLRSDGAASATVPVELIRQLHDAIVAKAGGWIGGFASGTSGAYYASHFWAYSALAAPFFVLLRALGGDGLYAFVAVNTVFLACAITYLFTWLGYRRSILCVLPVLCGTTFYLRWTGPEAMTASCVLIACIAVLRGSAGTALMMCGLAATQNPSVSLVIPIVIAARSSPFFFRAWQDHWRNMCRREWLLSASGIFLAAAPIAWSQRVFGVPSVLARYTTSLSSITWGRFCSLFTDLNQGMLVGIPGIFAVLLVLTPIAFKREPKRTTIVICTFALALIAMTIPVLSTSNWNAGGTVPMRYAYWLGIIPTSAVIGLLATAEIAIARIASCAVLLFQLGPLLSFGLYGEHTSHIKFTTGAQWTLQHYPRLYNPDPEIFYERSNGREDFRDLGKAISFPSEGSPTKILRHWSNLSDVPGLCGPRTVLISDSAENSDFGWKYLNAPFRCESMDRVAPLELWRIEEREHAGSDILGAGFAQAQGAGAWSQSIVSELVIPVNNRPVRSVRIHGRYYPPQHFSAVQVNGTAVGDIDLSDGVIEVPKAHRNDTSLVIKLSHPNARSPKSYGESGDTRLLGFYVQIVGLQYW